MPLIIMGVNCAEKNAVPLLCRAHPELFASANIIAAAPGHFAFLKDQFQDKLVPLELPARGFLASLCRQSAQGETVLVLANGDPLFFGLASALKNMDPGAPVQIIPAVSSLQAACARAGLPWADMAAFSLHGRDDISPLFKALNSGRNFCLLTGGGPGPDFAAAFMLDHGADDYTVCACENMGRGNERVLRLSLEECSRTLFSPYCACLFIHGKKARPSAAPYGAYSTPELRGALVLKLMDVRRDDTVWDVGAGSGLLSCEMAKLAGHGKVLAVEEKSSRALDIQCNRKIQGLPNLQTVFGRAPDILEDLPEPSRIFIGGGLSAPDADSLLDVCMERLAPGGNIVICCILLENLGKCLGRSWGSRAKTEVYQAQISHGAPLGKGGRLIAENPAFLIKIHKGVSDEF